MFGQPVLRPPPMRIPEDKELGSLEERRIHDIDRRQIYHPDRLADLEYLMRLGIMRDLIVGAAPRHGLVADVGCAQGNLPFLLREDGYRVVASDLRFDYVRYTRRKGPMWGIVANGEDLPFGDGTLDALVLGEVLEHVAHPDRFLTEARRVLRPGGALVASTPNGERRGSHLPTWVEVRGHAADLEGDQFKPDADGHLFLYTADELRELLGQAGFRQVRIVHYYSSLVARIAFKVSRQGWWDRFHPASPAAARTLASLDRLPTVGSTRPLRTSGLVACALVPPDPGAAAP